MKTGSLKMESLPETASFILNGAWLVWPETPRPRKAPPFQRKEAGLIALPHNLGSETEGDNVFNQAVSIGVAVKKPQKIWGYSGYFKNPDGKLRIIRFFRLAQKTEDNRKFFNEVSPPLTFE